MTQTHDPERVAAAMATVRTYHPDPENTAECGYCGYRGCASDFTPADGERGSECPECNMIDETAPHIDAEQIATELWPASRVLAAEVTRLRDIVEAAYREGIEDGREGWYNENDHRAPTDDDLWRDSTAKHAANPGGES